MVTSPLRFSVQITAVGDADRGRVMAYVLKRSSVERASLEERLRNPPVLLAREVSYATARRIVAALAARGATLALRASQTRNVLADVPLQGPALLRENLKPLLAAAFEPGDRANRFGLPVIA